MLNDNLWVPGLYIRTARAEFGQIAQLKGHFLPLADETLWTDFPEPGTQQIRKNDTGDVSEMFPVILDAFPATAVD